jgi:hypothetical protein
MTRTSTRIVWNRTFGLHGAVQTCSIRYVVGHSVGEEDWNLSYVADRFSFNIESRSRGNG